MGSSTPLPIYRLTLQLQKFHYRVILLISTDDVNINNTNTFRKFIGCDNCCHCRKKLYNLFTEVINKQPSYPYELPKKASYCLIYCFTVMTFTVMYKLIVATEVHTLECCGLKTNLLESFGNSVLGRNAGNHKRVSKTLISELNEI